MRVWFPRGRVAVELADGRQVATPLSFYPTLAAATARERGKWVFLGPGTAVERPGLDVQLSAESIVQGRREHVPPEGWAAGLEARLRAFRERRGGGKAARPRRAS